MLLRSKFKAVKPIDDGSCKREFVIVSRQDVKRKVFDDNGNFVREINDVVLESKPIPLKEKMHLGQTSDMYRISVLREAGVQVNQITNFDRNSLDEQSNVLDNIETLTEADFQTPAE